MRHLDISDCPGLTDASLRAVGKWCSVLESFSLGMCPLLTTGAIQEVRAESGRGQKRLRFFAWLLWVVR